MDDSCGQTAADEQAAAQPAAAIPPQATRWQRSVPWLILGVWLAIDLGVVIYWALQEWGFLGDLLLILALGFNLLGLVVWLTAFALLADWVWYLRLGYFAGGLAAASGLTEGMFHYTSQPDSALVVCSWIVGWSVPFLWMRRRGWRIAVPESLERRRGTWQFTIGDVLVATTQAGILLALLLAATPTFARSESTFYVLLLLTPPAVLIIALTWRQFWLAVLASLALSTALTLAPLWLLGANFSALDAFLVLGIVAAGAVSLLVAIGCLRRAGYRLR